MSATSDIAGAPMPPAPKPALDPTKMPATAAMMEHAEGGMNRTPRQQDNLLAQWSINAWNHFRAIGRTPTPAQLVRRIQRERREWSEQF